LPDKEAPHGRLKNGKPRKHKKKDPTVYNPRNKHHFIQKKDKNRFVGGVLSLKEIEEKLKNLSNNGQTLKAIQMLVSLESTIPKTDYDRMYKSITNV